jgi:hypothetical protein
MSIAQFSFLSEEFQEQFASAEWAERHALSDPGPSVIYAHKAKESGVKWTFGELAVLKDEIQQGLQDLKVMLA